MLIKRIVVRIAIVFLITGTPALRAGLTGFKSIQHMADAADLIIVASAVEATSSASSIFVRLRVHRVLKGNISNETLLFTEFSPFKERGDLRFLRSAQGLWFLKDNRTAGWAIIPATEGTILFSNFFFPLPTSQLGAAFSHRQDLHPVEKAALELGAAAENDDRELSLLLTRLGTLSSPAVREMYERFSRSAKPNLGVVGLSALTRIGDVSALARAERELSSLSSTREIVNLPWRLCDYRNPDPQGIAILGRLAASSFPLYRLQECAAYVLRKLHTRETLPILAGLLDSPKAEVRYNAALGLGSFANSSHIPLEEKLRWTKGQYFATTRGPYTTDETYSHFPTRELFDSNETKYINFWKNWWIRFQIDHPKE